MVEHINLGDILILANTSYLWHMGKSGEPSLETDAGREDDI